MSKCIGKGCPKQARWRGLCSSCHGKVMGHIKRGKTTDAIEVGAGRMLADGRSKAMSKWGQWIFGKKGGKS